MKLRDGFQTHKNLLAGLASSGLVALLGLITVPFYIRHLGVEMYGLIGFALTLQVASGVLDMGLTPIVAREVARSQSSQDKNAVCSLLHAAAVVYCYTGVAIAVLISLSAPLIAEYWLQPDQASVLVIRNSVILMGIVIAIRWPIALYQATLIGEQRLVASSAINMCMAFAGAFGAMAILSLVSSTIEAYFLWQGAVGFVHTMLMRRAAWRALGGPVDVRFDWSVLKSMWRLSRDLSAVGVLALLIAQSDKLILSRTLVLSEYGHYMIATLVSGAIYLIVIPCYNVIFPRLSSLTAEKRTQEIVALYRNSTNLLSSSLFPLAMLLALFSEELVYVWTSNAELAAKAAPLVSLLSIGSALHGVMYVTYALQLAHGKTALALRTNAVLLVLLLPLVTILSIRHGGIGAAAAWAVLHVFYFCFGSWLTHRHIFGAVQWSWLAKDILFPFCISLTIMAVNRMAGDADGIERFALATTTTIGCFFISVAVMRARAQRSSGQA